MSRNNSSYTLTHHAMLVIWGQYARQLDLIEVLESVVLHQKKRDYGLQTKVIEFLVATLPAFTPPTHTWILESPPSLATFTWNVFVPLCKFTLLYYVQALAPTQHRNPPHTCSEPPELSLLFA
jgi:hypothetical protein